MNERAIFLEALDRDDPLQRAAFVDAACAGDDALRQRVAALLKSHEEAGAFLGKLAPQRLAEEWAIPPTDCETQGGTSVNDTAGDDLDFLAPSDRPDALGRLAHYEILEVIGRGGMGIVLRAFDEKLHRVVAIKVMAAQLATNAAARRRFSREAQAQAAVSHDHIVTIHAVEEAAGLPYLVMQCVAGMSLQERLDRAGPLELHEILRIGMQTASALAAAHAQGLIHRDIKPANILLENGVERVKITDFGLARAVADASLTQSGIVAGTPHYMSPEQARGDAVDQRTDLFSLGSVLYAMCTGRTPFRASGSIAVLKRVCEETPRPIHETNVAIPDWLIAIIGKLQAKDPAERYQSATEVADLLSRHLAHVQHPSVASLPGPPAPKPIGRSRWVVATAVLVVALGSLSLSEATGVTNFTGTVIRIVTGEGTLIIEVADPTVQVSLDGEELTIRGGGVEQFRLRPGQYEFRATRNGQPVKQELVTITRGGEKVVTVSREAVERTTAATDPRSGPLSPGEIRRFVGHTQGVISVAVSSDGKRILSGGEDKVLRLWDTATGEEVRRFEGHTDAILRVGLSSDGRWALSTSQYRDQSIRLWDLTKGTLERVWSGPGWHSVAVFSPNGTQILSGTGNDVNNCELVLRDIESGIERRRFKGHTAPLSWMAFSTDGNRVLSGSFDGTVRLWDVTTATELACLRGHTGLVLSVALSRDGRRALSSGADGTMRLWDLEGKKELNCFECTKGGDWIHCVAFSPDDRHALAAGGGVWLWDLHSTKLLQRIEGSITGVVAAIAFMPDGSRAVTAGLDGKVRLWELPKLNAEKQAFVRLGGQGIQERKFDTLAEAVQRAGDGDTIEIRGNGPFLSGPIGIGELSLTIRAARGHHPVVRFNREGTAVVDTMLEAGGTLVLEGLELHWIDQQEFQYGSTLIRPAGKLFVANCCFRSGGPSGPHVCIGSWVAACEVRNCLFVPAYTAVSATHESGTSVMENCIHVGAHQAFNMGSRHNPRCRLSHNTLLAAGHALHTGHDELLSKEPPVKLISIEAIGNIIDADTVWLFHERDANARAMDLQGGRGESFLTARCAWTGTENLYHVRGQYSMWLREPVISWTGPHELPGWKKLWNSPETGSLEGSVRFQGGDLLSRVNTAPAEISAADFRLRPDSAGYQAGADGKDLGADVDLVGPGAAYERWKKTPAYQEWQKETRQSRPAAQPQSSQTPPKSLLDTLDPAQIPADERFNLQPKELVQVLGEHRGRPWVAPICVAYRGDGKLAASGGYDGYVYLWDTDRLQLRAMLEGHGRGKAVWCLAFLPDNRRLLSAGDDNLVRLWDVEAQRELRRFEGHTGVAGSVAVSHDGRRALTGAGDRLLRLWDIETAEEIRRFEGHTDRVTSVAFSPDDTQALSGSDDKTMRLWDVATGEQIRQFVGHAVNVRMVRFLPDGRRAVSCSHDKTVRLWNLQSGDELKLYEGHTGQVVSVDVSPDGQRAVSTGADRSIRLWDLENGQKLRPVAAARGAPFSTVAFSPDGRRVMSGEWYSVLRLWDLESGAELSPPLVDPIGGVGEIARVAFSADGSRVLACISHSDVARLFDVASARQLHSLKLPVSNNVALFSTDGREALCGGERGLTVWSVETGQELRRFEGASNISSIALSQDGRFVLTGDHTGPNGSLQVWQYGTGRELQRLRGHTGAVQSVALSADARRALSGGMDKIVRLWDLDSGSVLHQWQQSNTVWSVALSPDGRYAAASDDDGFVRLWDLSARLPTPRPLPRLHTRHVRAIAFSPDCRTLASAGGDGRIVIWDTATGTSLREIRMPGSVMGLTYAPDGRHLAAANSNTTIYILRLAAPENTITDK